jgi:hypothetical protein
LVRVVRKGPVLDMTQVGMSMESVANSVQLPPEKHQWLLRVQLGMKA